MTAPAPRELPELTPIQAMWRGTVTALVIVAPVAIANNVVIDPDNGEFNPVALVFFALTLLGGAAGGWATVRLSPAAGLAYPAGSAALAYALVQAVGVVRRLAAGDELSWLGYPLAATLIATCGMLGGMFARRWMQN